MMSQMLAVGAGARKRLYLLTADADASTDLSGTNDVDFTRNRMSELTVALDANSEYLIRGLMSLQRPGAASPVPSVRFSRSADVDAACGRAHGSRTCSVPETPLGWSSASAMVFGAKARLVLDTDTNQNRRVQLTSSATASGARGFIGPFLYIKTGSAAVNFYCEGYSDSPTAPTRIHAGSYLIVEKL